MIKDLIIKTRSYRRFDYSAKISEEMLIDLIDIARNVSSGGNIQPLKYILSADEEKNKEIFPCLRWAGYLPEWTGPKESERPTAYIIVLGDTRIISNFGVDPGIATQSIMLGATEKGFGGCTFGSISRKQLRNALSIANHFEILNVLALGKPVETVVIEPIGEDGSIRYYRDENDVHHIPKRSLDEIIIK